ncbi:MAG: hypothetical protein COV67_03805, partial [Nitrospinae bacterium CG11_big_fil_rev_8_21_14_0_20_56_8]
LYRVADSPAAVPSSRPEDRVRGEIYRLEHPGRVFQILDEYEGCPPSSAGSGEFLRGRAWIQLDSGDNLETWIYLYDRSVAGLSRIASGDFLI